MRLKFPLFVLVCQKLCAGVNVARGYASVFWTMSILK